MNKHEYKRLAAYMGQYGADDPAPAELPAQISEHEQLIAARQRIAELESERALAVRVAWKAMDSVIFDRCAWGKVSDDFYVDGVSIGDVRKVMKWYVEIESRE